MTIVFRSVIDTIVVELPRRQIEAITSSRHSRLANYASAEYSLHGAAEENVETTVAPRPG